MSRDYEVRERIPVPHDNYLPHSLSVERVSWDRNREGFSRPAPSLTVSDMKNDAVVYIIIRPGLSRFEAVTKPHRIVWKNNALTKLTMETQP